MKASFAATTLLVAFSLSPAQASCLSEVSSFAKDICGEIEKSGSQTMLDATGNIDVGVNKIIKKVIGNASGTVSGKILYDTYTGVVRNDLSKTIFNIIECKQKMVAVAVAQVCSHPAATNSVDNVGEALSGGFNYFDLTKGDSLELSEARILFILRGYTGPLASTQGVEVAIGRGSTYMYPGQEWKVPLDTGSCEVALIKAVVNGDARFRTNCSVHQM